MSQFRKKIQSVNFLKDLPSSGAVTVNCCRVIFVDDKLQQFGPNAKTPGCLFNALIADTTTLVDLTVFCYDDGAKLHRQFSDAEGKLCRIEGLLTRMKDAKDVFYGKAVNPIQLTAGSKTVITYIDKDDGEIPMGTEEDKVNPEWVKSTQDSLHRSDDRSASGSTTSMSAKRGREDHADQKGRPDEAEGKGFTEDE